MMPAEKDCPPRGDVEKGITLEVLADRLVELPRAEASRTAICSGCVQGDPLERVYPRGDIIKTRRQLMQARAACW